MTTPLPNLTLSLTKKTDLKNESTNTNTINNNIIINPTSQETERSSADLKKSTSLLSMTRAETPDNVKSFKEAFILILISYFKNNVVLLNNLVELSDKIITKQDDLKHLISLLLDITPKDVEVEVEEVTISGCCGKFCQSIPRYRKVKNIIINKKQSFAVSYNQFFVQMGTEFNISMEYILL
jgi:hypothetical protein